MLTELISNDIAHKHIQHVHLPSDSVTFSINESPHVLVYNLKCYDFVPGTILLKRTYHFKHAALGSFGDSFLFKSLYADFYV